MIFQRGHCHQSQGTPRPGSQLSFRAMPALRYQNMLQTGLGIQRCPEQRSRNWSLGPWPILFQSKISKHIQRYICIALGCTTLRDSRYCCFSRLLNEQINAGHDDLSAPVSFAKLQTQRRHLKSGTFMCKANVLDGWRFESLSGESYGTNPYCQYNNIMIMYLYIVSYSPLAGNKALSVLTKLSWGLWKPIKSGSSSCLFALRWSRLQDLTNISQVSWLQPKDQVATRRKSNRCYLCCFLDVFQQKKTQSLPYQQPKQGSNTCQVCDRPIFVLPYQFHGRLVGMSGSRLRLCTNISGLQIWKCILMVVMWQQSISFKNYTSEKYKWGFNGSTIYLEIILEQIQISNITIEDCTKHQCLDAMPL